MTIEFHHPLSNLVFVAEELRKILISDFWFYMKIDNRVKAFDIIINMFEDLLKKDLKEESVIIIIKSLLEFNTKVMNTDVKPLIHHSLSILHKGLGKHFKAYIHSCNLFKKHLLPINKQEAFIDCTFQLYRDIISRNIEFWRKTDIEPKLNMTVSNNIVIDKAISNTEEYLIDVSTRIKSAHSLAELFLLPAFEEVADFHERAIDGFFSFVDKFHYIFYLLQVEGMDKRHERLIWSINKLLCTTIDEVEQNDLVSFIDMIFVLCDNMHEKHPSSVLDVIFTLGKKVIDKDTSEDKNLINYFEKKTIQFGFESPGMIFVSEDWQLHINNNHIKNIRIWLELIEYSETAMEKLLASLIVNLKIGGIFINDTDLFQRDITKILNSNIAPYYKKIKQLARIFPVYFNEIGAEGDIRDATTSMDEIYKRHDKLIHFLRKQVHTESNNTLIDLTRKVFRYWYDGDINKLKEDLPNDVFASLNTKSDFFLPIHNMLRSICDKEKMSYMDILELSVEEIEKIIDKKEYQDNQRDVLRIVEVVRLYALLKEKYSFETVNIIPMLERYTFFKQDEIDALDSALKEDDYSVSLTLIYSFMNQLKKIITDSKISEGWENIYHKRHIAIGIPSMYGTYREIKFEALGLTYRLERIATNLMENVVNNINLDYISGRTLQNIYEILNYFIKGLELDGITSQSFNSNLLMLKYSLTSQSLSLYQYINIFQFMADDIKKVISKYFLKSYEYPLGIAIIQHFDKNGLLSTKDKNRLINEKSEVFYREIISGAFLVQPLDSFVSRILTSLRDMVDNTKPEWIHDVMTYNSDMAISPFYIITPELDNQVFLGSKAYFLKKLYNAGFPIPPGFVITTEVFRRIEAIVNHPVIKKEYDKKIWKEIARLEEISKKKYGDPKNPLLLSVRSGTAISMPGAMDTFLNVGMNDELTEKLSKQPNCGWTSWDCYRRLIQSWGMYHGIPRDAFDAVIMKYKEKNNIQLKIHFKPDTMRDIAYAYKDILKENNIIFEQDLKKQLSKTIRFVFKSWSSKRAQVYRDHLQIADEWGTAVVVQKMILGNLNTLSGTGVVFTQNPNRHRPGVHLYGDFSLNSQGEDIVGGLVNVHPVGETQRKHQDIKEQSLQKMLPDIYNRIYHLSKQLTEKMGYNPQEIEFTFESEQAKDLYILQTRDQDIKKKDVIDIFSISSDKMNLAGRGIGIGEGALNGLIAFDSDDLNSLKEKNPDNNIILVRPDTVPDDINLIFECDGLLTAKGGATSHAAVTAVRLGKTCVVNCSSLFVNDDKKICHINGIPFRSGDKIALDANTGNIFEGNYPTEKIEISTI